MSAPRHKLAAHFLLTPELANSPPNEAIISGLLEHDYQVDLYAPGAAPDLEAYGPRVRFFHAEYGERWLARNLFRPHWRRYRLFSGTTEDPMAVAGSLAVRSLRPSFTLADEIRSGAYGGSRSGRWKALCRWAMRRSQFTIVNDAVRIPLQREYAGLSPEHEILIYPGCFRNPPAPAERATLRAARGIPEDALVLCYSGTISHGNGGVWLAQLLERAPNLHVWGQLLVQTPLVRGLMQQLRGGERFYLEQKQLSWHDAWASMAGVDIGMVVYLHTGAQFQNMGISSNRLCMFLAMGVPVIATRQPSFEFIERYDCGILVDDVDGLVNAVEQIRHRLPTMRENALRCAREYIGAPGHYRILLERLGKLR